MSSPAQIAANRRNAMHSTGPKSDDGKARSAMNALKSGIDADSLVIPGESPDAFAQLRDQYYSTYAPADPEQLFYINKAVRHDWLLRRFERVEEQLWALAASRIEKPVAHLELGQSFDKENPTMMRLHRRMAHSEKAYDQAMQTFHRLQAQKPAPQRKQITVQNAELASFLTIPDDGPSDPFLDDLEAQIREAYASGPDPKQDTGQ